MKVLTLILAMVVTMVATTATFANSPAAKRVAVMLVVQDDDDDARTVTTIFTTLMSAEKVAKMLDVEVTMSNDPIADDVFVFGLKSQSEKELALKLFDEEGYEMADNATIVTEGSNYKQLNVTSLPDGTYTFQVTDKEGAKFEREITVERGKAVK